MLDDKTELYLKIGSTKLDPAEPTLECVLARGFAAMGWLQPQSAAYDMVVAAANRVNAVIEAKKTINWETRK